MSFSVSFEPMTMQTRLLLVLALLLPLAGCAPVTPAPVVDMTRPATSAGQLASAPESPPAAQPTKPGHYQVRPGDTLYSIAFRHQLDWIRLAAWNGIGVPYTIVPGQDLRLSPAPGQVVTFGAADTAKPVQPVGVDTPPVPAADDGPTTASRGDTAAPPKDEIATAPTASEPGPADPSAAAASAPSRHVAGIAWLWPARGSLLGRFVASDPTRQGIDIGGTRGDPVRAAADGVVVYSGNGLVGYGELIIVKHSDAYLSAYGHNSKRLVEQGDRVQAGQTIARMGSTGTDRVELHFEIRKHGQPVDPLGFLPRT